MAAVRRDSRTNDNKLRDEKKFFFLLSAKSARRLNFSTIRIERLWWRVFFFNYYHSVLSPGPVGSGGITARTCVCVAEKGLVIVA